MELHRHIDRLGRILMLTIAVVMLVTCAVLGFVPLDADGVGCGSAFIAGDEFTSPVACSTVRSFMQPFAWSALGAALVFGLAAIAFAPAMVDAIKHSSPVPDTGE